MLKLATVDGNVFVHVLFDVFHKLFLGRLHCVIVTFYSAGVSVCPNEVVEGGGQTLRFDVPIGERRIFVFLSGRVGRSHFLVLFPV